MRQPLFEGATGGFDFIVDRTKPFVNESRPNGSTYTRIPGRFSVCDCVNGNGRRYSKRVWEKNLVPGSPLQESIKRYAAFGLLEHPKDGIVTLLSPISHHVTKAEMVESKDASGKSIYEVTGEIALYNTPEGLKLKALIEGGYNPLVSSRGYGSLTKGPDGVDEVQDDYVCESWDVVIKPSFETAELAPDRSTTTARLAPPFTPNPTAESQQSLKEAVVCEAQDNFHGTTTYKVCGHASHCRCSATATRTLEGMCPGCKMNLKESKPSSGVAGTTAASPPQTSNIMELKDIRSRITALESMDMSKLDPRRLAESVGQIEELHQQIEEAAAGQPKSAWEAKRMHDSLDRVSTQFSESVQAPSKQARKLAENNTKLMKVINAVASTAVTYKKKLGETMKAQGGQTKLVEELTRRGKGWQKVAESRKARFAQLEEDFTHSCEALDLIAKRYHEDTTEMGRRIIQLEFKEKAQDAAIQKRLKEATRLRHIAAIREELEGKKPGTAVQENEPGVGKPKEGEQPKVTKKPGDKKGEGEGEKVAEEPGKVTNENKQPAAAAPAPITEARVVLRESADPRGLSESVEMVKRLSIAK